MLWIVAVLATTAHAGDYWVKNGGSDGADGHSQASAWATLPHAADQVAAGDTVHVLDGSYQGFYLTTSGAPGAPITFKAEGPAVQITQDNPTTADGINLEGASYVVVDGFVVNDRTRAGIRAVTASHVTVRNCSLGYNGRWGILTGFVDDFLAEDNEAHHSQAEHGIYVSNSCARPIVRRNHVHDNQANGLHFNGDASLGGDGLIQNALVEGNVIHGNGVGGGSGINMDGGVNGVIRNNLLYDNHASGISLYQIDAGAPATGNLIVNNTILTASDGRWCVNIADGSTGNTLRNNILWNAHSFRGAITIDAASLSGFSSDYNSVIDRMSDDGGDTVMTLADWQGLGYDAHSFVASPSAHFLVPGSDFHLLASSPAVDVGTLAGAPSTDLDGNPRPMGGGVDLGAYELQLLECGDGNLDPGEACEQDTDCASGQTCLGCGCVTPPLCASGIGLGKPRTALRAALGQLAVRADAVIPEPWTGIDPPAHGIRIVVSSDGGGGFDVTVPGGGAWTSGTRRWVYRDKTGAVGGVTKVVVQDRRNRAAGLARVVVKGKAGSLVMPDPSSTVTTIVLGDAGECASVAWHPPSGTSPRCRGDAARVVCK
jgi:Right handed beta helix region